MHSMDDDTAFSMTMRIAGLKTTRLNLWVCLWQKSTTRFLRVCVSGRRLIVLWLACGIPAGCLISEWGSIGNSGRHNMACVCRGTSRHFKKALINFCVCTSTVGLEILLDTYYVSTYLNSRLEWHDQCLSIASTKGDDGFSDMGGLSVTLAEVQFLSNLPFYKYCIAILSHVHQDLVCVVWGNDRTRPGTCAQKMWWGPLHIICHDTPELTNSVCVPWP